MLYSIDRSKRIRLLPILIFIPYPKKMDKFIITLYFQTFGGNTMRITVEKRIEISNKIYPFYNAFSMDLLFYIAIVFSLFIEYWNTTNNSSSPLFGFENYMYLDDYIYYLAIITTVFSLIMYFKQFYQQGYLKKENLKI